MALIPVFKKCTRDYLMRKCKVTFPASEWVEAEINGELYESNRYDIRYRDKEEDKTISVYLYMNEDSDEILAIDEVVENVKTHEHYELQETPFLGILDHIMKNCK